MSIDPMKRLQAFRCGFIQMLDDQGSKNMGREPEPARDNLNHVLAGQLLEELGFEPSGEPVISVDTN